MNYRKLIFVILLSVLSFIPLASCKDMCPRSGRWETEDKSLLISFEVKPYEAHFILDGNHRDYYLSIEHGSREIELYVTFDEDPSFVGKTLSYSENEWVVLFDNREYSLHLQSNYGDIVYK